MSVIVILSLSFGLGIGVGLWLPAPGWAALVTGLGGVVIMAASLLSGKQLALVSVAGLFLIGWTRPAPVPVRLPASPTPPCYRVIQGRIASLSAPVDGRLKMVIELDSWSSCLHTPKVGGLTATSGTLRLTVLGEEPLPLHPGDRIRVRAKVKAFAAHRNPGVRPFRNSAARFSAYLENRGLIALVEAHQKNSLLDFHGTRNRLARFWQRTLDPRAAAMARALSLGDTTGLDPAMRDHFRRTGASHLLAVSGLHLGLVVLFVFWLVRRVLFEIPGLARQGDVGRLAALCTIPVVWCFALLTGARIPVVRAGVMATGALAARATGRSAATVEALCLAGAVLLLKAPGSLFEPGFQLSFSAVLSFVAVLGSSRHSVDGIRFGALAPQRSVWRRMGQVIINRLGALFRASLAASAATTPFVLYHFGYASWVAAPVNLVAVPFVSFLVMPTLLLVTFLAIPFPVAAAGFAPLGGWLLGLLDGALGRVAELPCTIENPALLDAAAIFAGCLGTLFLLARARRVGLICLAGAAVLGIASPWLSPARLPPDQLTVDFLDVGQGDATLITFPNGSHWLVDAGGSGRPPYDVGTRIVVPVLRALGVRKLEKVVLTHPDLDHMAGLPAVLSAMGVEELWENGQGSAEGAENSYELMLAQARRRGVVVRRTPDICGPHRVGAARLFVVHPCAPPERYDPTRSFNDNSIVIFVEYGRFSLALPGDIGQSVERALVTAGANRRIDLLKLPHHGSRTASSPLFLDALSPKFGVASVGLFNRYRFPHADLLRRFSKRGIPVFRTDRHGAVRFTTDGEKVTVRVFE